MREKSLKELIALTLIPGLGNRKVQSLLDSFGDASEVFKQSKRSLLRVEGIGEASALGILSFKDWDRVKQILNRTNEIGAELLTYSSSNYPPHLKRIYDPPLLLWVKGNPSILQSKGIAVVGTRSPSGYGKRIAELLTKDLIHQQLTIISGLAYGIDTIAHQTTVEHAGNTIAVLGSGIDVIYPWRNSNLANKIIETGGAVISEFPPGSKPDAGNFPIRNRIVSGLSLGVLVIESGVQGGSLITAELALDQGREVFSVPHTMENVKGNGCNYLIKSGQAKLVQGVHDIMDELPVDAKPGNYSKNIGEISKLDDVAKAICNHLESSEYSVDELAELMNMQTSSVLVQLLELEMNGLIRQKAGKVFKRP